MFLFNFEERTASYRPRFNYCGFFQLSKNNFFTKINLIESFIKLALAMLHCLLYQGVLKFMNITMILTVNL